MRGARVRGVDAKRRARLRCGTGSAMPTIGRFERARRRGGVEQRARRPGPSQMRRAAARRASASRASATAMRDVAVDVARDELGQARPPSAGSPRRAPRTCRRASVTTGTAGPQRVAGRRVRVVRPRVEEEVGVRDRGARYSGLGRARAKMQPRARSTPRAHRLAAQVARSPDRRRCARAATARRPGTAARIRAHASITSGLSLYVALKQHSTIAPSRKPSDSRGAAYGDRPLRDR